MSQPLCFKISPADNVATLLNDITTGEARVLGDSAAAIPIREEIKLGHKVALVDIPMGSAITKFGVRIGHASRDIRAGEWVHLHNLCSDFDDRSQTLDLHSGAATDTQYE